MGQTQIPDAVDGDLGTRDDEDSDNDEETDIIDVASLDLKNDEYVFRCTPSSDVALTTATPTELPTVSPASLRDLTAAEHAQLDALFQSLLSADDLAASASSRPAGNVSGRAVAAGSARPGVALDDLTAAVARMHPIRTLAVPATVAHTAMTAPVLRFVAEIYCCCVSALVIRYFQACCCYSVFTKAP